MDKETQIIEINGVKLEVDMRYAKRVENYKVGDKVKVLIKTYSDTFNSYYGVIAGFDNFKNRPAIIVAYMETSYSSAELKFVHITKDSKDVELCAAHDFDLSYTKSDIIQQFDKMINVKQQEMRDIESKKKYFVEKFSKHFEMDEFKEVV